MQSIFGVSTAETLIALRILSVFAPLVIDAFISAARKKKMSLLHLYITNESDY